MLAWHPFPGRPIIAASGRRPHAPSSRPNRLTALRSEPSYPDASSAATTPDQGVIERGDSASMRFPGVLHGVTWTRVGLFVLIWVLMAAASAPTARAIGYGAGLPRIAEVFLVSLAMYAVGYGVPTLGIVAVFNRTGPGTWQRIVGLLAAVVLGSLVPVLVGTGMADLVGIRAASLRFYAAWVESMSELGAVCVAWIVLARRDGTRAALRQAEVDRITMERQLAEARLGALQAQIEPHFLFNTLANVRWLLRTDRPAGRVMVQRLSRYLESSLPTLRDTRSTLGRELALTSAYLDVQRIRMGSRLRSSVDCPRPLHAAVFPPLMLMTLVENAIKHGLSSLPDGGQVAVTAEVRDGRLRVQVRDTGTGFKQNAGKGIGIANTRARLSALYGDHARLSLAAGAEGGVMATIELPFEQDGQRAA